MAIRTTSAAVQALMLPGKDYDTENAPSLTGFIATASVIVDRAVTCASNRGITISDTESELMERWVAAHAYCMSDPTYASKSTQGASASFTGQTGMHLEQTRYGQTAMDLDPSGCLARVGKQKFAYTAWLGLPESGQTDYEDRN